MARKLMLLALLAMAATAFAGEIPLDRNGLPQWEIRRWDDFPVVLELDSPAALESLLSLVPLSRFDREQFTPVGDSEKSWTWQLATRVTEDEQRALLAAGYRPRRVEDAFRANREEAERVWAAMAAEKADPAKSLVYDYFPNHTQVGTILAGVAANHPALARTFTYGTSVQGRALWGIVISANVNVNEAEPEVRLSSSMHGDEVTGMVLTLDLVNYLTENYGQPGYEDVTYLVDNYEIHIMPMYNPDGTAAAQRYNANGVDLNRNFPEPAGTDPTQEIENLQYMSYANAHHFVLSVNYHGGALVVNYLWDYTYTRAPDDAALILMSLEYSTYNLPMYNGSFTQGITNGADWYVVTGSLQDWNYDQTGCIDTTIEVSNTKWPAASTLVGFWNDNRESMMHWIKSARYGVNGVVTGADSGLPLDAVVTVTGNSKTVRTDPANGDYYKLLPTGTFDLTFTATGYITRTITGVSTTWGTPTVLDVVMQPVAHGDIDGTVSETGGAPLAATIDVYTHPLNVHVTNVASSAVDGSFTVPYQLYGDYRLVYSAPGHLTVEQLVTLDAATVTAPPVTLGIAEEVVLFGDDFEGGLGQWSGGWGVDTPGYNSPTAMNDSPGGLYGANQTLVCAMAAGVDLTDATSGALSYRAHWVIEANWDGAQLQVSTDGGSAWTALQTPFMQPGSGQGAQVGGQYYYEGTQADWILETIDLAPWLGLGDVRFRFVVVTDSSVYKDGLWIDDFTIEGIRPLITGIDTPAAVDGLHGAQPNPFNPGTTIVYESARAGRVQLEIYDVSGRRVRTLVDRVLAAGEHRTAWDGRDDAGSRVGSGVYFARFRGATGGGTAKLVLVK